MLSRRPRRKRRGRSPARSPGRGCSPLAGFCGTRRARGRRVPRSVPRALFGFPAPLRRLVKACLASAAGGAALPPGSAALRRFFRGRAAGGFAPAPRCARGSVSGQAATPLRAAASPPGLPSAPPLPPLLAPLRLALGRLVPALPGARLRPRLRLGRPRSPWGAALFPRVAARFARPRCAPLPAAAGCGGCLVARPPPYAPPLRRRLCGVFGGRVFRGLRPRGRGLRFAPPMAARVSVGGSVRPPTFHRGRAPPFSAVAKRKKTARGSRYTNSAKPQGDINTYLTRPKLNKKFFYFV